MENISLNQRYTSKGEPELGIGIVKEIKNNKVLIFFPMANDKRMYSMESAPLLRVVFKPGDTIIDTKGQSIVVEQVEKAKELYVYYGKNSKLSEADLGNMSITQAAENRLFMGDVDMPKSFALRRETLLCDYKKRLSATKGFVGGRIDLIPHQLYIAHEVSSRYAPRVLLSDQVGLGKTIEACLILHRLLLSERISRVIILVPESLVHQWFVEVLRRFNLWFNIFDEERCASLDGSAPDNNPFLDDQLIICSTDFLASSSKRTQQAIAAGWDMLVVDEAHHLEWSVDYVSPKYAIVEQLSKVAKGLLLLTATPEQLGEESHFARLRLLDPNRYANFNDFLSECSDPSNIADIVKKLHLGKNLLTKDTKLLTSLFSKERIQSLANADDVAKNKLIEDLLDQHGPGRVLFRNTRSAMNGFPKRIAHLIPLTAVENQTLWSKRLMNEFINETDSTTKLDEQKFWFTEDPRVQWLLKEMKTCYPEKVLLICKTKAKVLALEEALNLRTNMKVGVFHEDLSIIQRDRNAAWFSEPDGAQLLLCSEIGSEGRNFQFAHQLILFDLPLHPELLEQRIGRLDRIGQTEDIHIHVPYFENSPQHKLAKWFHEGVNAFETNIEGGNEISKLFSTQLLELSKSESISVDSPAMDTLINETSNFRKKLQKRLADGRDRLLEMNSFRPKIAMELQQQIQAEDNDRSLETYFTKVLNHFDIEMEDLAARTYFLQPSSETTGIFPSIPPEGLSVTFDRKRALSREDIAFLSWDHPLATSSIDMVLSSGTGSASFAQLRGSKGAGILLELLFVIETASKQGIYIDRFLANTPIRIVVNHTGMDVTEQYSIELFNKNLTPGDIEPILDNDMLIDEILPNMISAAKKIAEARRTNAIKEGLQKMNLTLNHEIDRLKVLQQKNNNIRPDEIQIALDEHKSLTTLIESAKVRLDALQLIIKQ